MDPSGVINSAIHTETPSSGLPVSTLVTLLTGLRSGIELEKVLEQLDANEKKRDDEEAEATQPKYECPICISAYIRPTVIKVCGHVFCDSCIAQALKTEKKCPTCRTKATKRHLLKIHL